MKLNFTKTLASVLFIFLISFQAYGNKTSSQKEELKGYVPVDYSIKRKSINGMEFIQICNNNLEIRIFQYSTTNDGRNLQSLIQFMMNGKLLNNWVKNTFYAENNTDIRGLIDIYFNNENEYFILLDNPIPDSHNNKPYEEIYFVSKKTIKFEGSYSFPENININDDGDIDIIADENPYIFFRIDDSLKFALVDANKKEYVYDNYKRIISSDSINKSLLKQAESFDWETAFSPSVYYKEGFSFNNSGEEEYKIDWDRREIIALNDAAKYYLDTLSVGSSELRIRFSKDSLIIESGYYDRNWEFSDSRTYYFLKSNELNDVILNKVIEDKGVVANSNSKYLGTDQNIPLLTVRYIYNDFGNISFHDFNESGSPYQMDINGFPLDNYNRDFALDELAKLVSSKMNEYYYDSYRNVFGCEYDDFYVYPKPGEIFLRLSKTPLTAQTVQDYNNIAFYILEFAKLNEQADSYTDAAVTLLEKITAQFPDRVVTYLNLGDAYWLRNSEGDKRKARTAYKKYVELMQLQQKDMKRVPARVNERITK